MVPWEDLDSTLKRPVGLETETGVFWRENPHLRHGCVCGAGRQIWTEWKEAAGGERGTSGLESQKPVSTSDSSILGCSRVVFSCINLAFNEQFPVHRQGVGVGGRRVGREGSSPVGGVAQTIRFLRGSHTTGERVGG